MTTAEQAPQNTDKYTYTKNNNVDNDKGFVTMVATMGIQLVHLVLVYKD